MRNSRIRLLPRVLRPKRARLTILPCAACPYPWLFYILKRLPYAESIKDFEVLSLIHRTIEYLKMLESLEALKSMMQFHHDARGDGSSHQAQQVM